MRKPILLALAGAALATMTGCVSTATGGLEVAVREGGGASVRIDDAFFRSHVEIEDSFARRTAAGFLEAKVRVRNRHGRDFPLQYKFAWFDADGMEVQVGARPWEQTTLHGGEAATLAATAPEPRVTRFVIRLRRVK